MNEELHDVFYIHLKVFTARENYLPLSEAQRGSVPCSGSVAWLESECFIPSPVSLVPEHRAHPPGNPLLTPVRHCNVSHTAQNSGPLSEGGVIPLPCCGIPVLKGAGPCGAFLTSAQSFPGDVSGLKTHLPSCVLQQTSLVVFRSGENLTS